MNSFFKFNAPKPTTQPLPEARANAAGTQELILIVDDEESVTLVAQHVLTAEGYRVITARDGFQALDLFRKFHPDIRLVILDFVMPIMDGGQVLGQMRKIDSRVPVLLTSGFTANESLRELLSKGLCDFIPKPLAHKKLLHSVRSTLGAQPVEGAGASALSMS